MEGIAPKTAFKLSDIKGPYPLLGAFLLIVESLLGFWLFRATTGVERTIAGFLMVALLAGFLYVVGRMQKQWVSVPSSPGLPGKVTVATQVATKQEIEAPEPQKIAGPDRSYLINKPPPSWSVREMSFPEYLSERMEVGAAAKAVMMGNSEENVAKDILVFRAPHDTWLVPQPGKTSYEGRILIKAISATIPIQLTILPIDRYPPPLFVQRPIEHNFVSFLANSLASGLTVRALASGKLPNSDIPYVQAELRQDSTNAVVNGKPGLDVSLYAVLMAIEGQLTDHLLILNYPSIKGDSDPALNQALKDLLTLANSFKPLEVTRERRAEIEKKKEQEFEKFLEQNKEEIFGSELALAFLRFDESDMKDADRRNEAIEVLKPFELAYKAYNLEDSELDLNSLWAALHTADTGDATEFISQFLRLRAALESDAAPADGDEKEALALQAPSTADDTADPAAD